MIEQADFLFRMIAIGAGLMLIAQVVAGEVRSTIKLPLVAMIVGSIAYLIGTPLMKAASGPLDPWVGLLAKSVPFSIWLFARNLFEREPERRFVLAALATLLVGWVLNHFVRTLGLDLLGFLLIMFVSLVLIADLVRIGVFERTDDLVEQRRVIRLWLPLLVAAQAGGVVVFEIVEALTDHTELFALIHLVNTLLILTITLFAGLALFRTDPDLLVADEPETTDEAEQDKPVLTPSETVLHDKLSAAMASGLYREPGLTIAALAEKLDTPEHRLRALINRRMGYRNFSAFLNRYRIAEAREKLASRDDVDLPVLTIAMDLGYNSLPTFNRAFRADTGTTPSDYRRSAIGNGADAPESAEQF